MEKTTEKPTSETINLDELLNGAKFKLDYYQREYRWEERQIKDLIDDLCNKFNKKHKLGLKEVKDYDHYFLGSIIITDKEGKKFIVDGQQRLVTLTLLFIHIYRLFNDEQRKERLKEKYEKKEYDYEEATKGDIPRIISTMKAGEYLFNIEVKKWQECLQALLLGNDYKEYIKSESESIKNIVKNFEKIKKLFRNKLKDESLPYFTEWLKERVYLDVITTHSDDDSYISFETMNDRGLSITPAEMLKGYILANIKEEGHREEAHKIWRAQVAALKGISRQEDETAIKIWLRSRYAKDIKDFNLIGEKFNRWVYDNKEALKLENDTDFFDFIKKYFKFYSSWYIRLHKAEKSPEGAKEINQNSEVVDFCGQNEIILFMLLAVLEREDDDQVQERKLKIVFSYLDILIAQDHWNRWQHYWPLRPRKMLDIRDSIKGKDIPTLADKLISEIDERGNLFYEWRGSLTPKENNRKKIKKLLARIASHVETASGGTSRYAQYLTHEIEHLWGKEHHKDVKGFEEPKGLLEFGEYRDYIGALILLPSGTGENQSLGDKLYEDKVEYYTDNLLAYSLHDNAYKHNPGFNKFNQSISSNSDTKFEPYPHFGRTELGKRQRLYKCLAEKIWDPERLKRAAVSEE